MIREYLANRRQKKENAAWEQDFFEQIKASIAYVEAGGAPRGHKRFGTPWRPKWNAVKYIHGAPRIGNGTSMDVAQAMANDPYGLTEDEYRTLHKHNLIWLLTKKRRSRRSNTRQTAPVRG